MYFEFPVSSSKLPVGNESVFSWELGTLNLELKDQKTLALKAHW
jgi:hypothetical protein